MNIKFKAIYFSAFSFLILTACGGSVENATERNVTAIFIDKSGSLGVNQKALTDILNKAQGLFSKKGDAISIYPIHENTSSADAFYNIASERECGCDDLPTAQKNSCLESCGLQEVRESKMIKDKLTEALSANARESSLGTDVLGLIERTCAAFKSCTDPNAKKNIIVYSDMLQESQRPQRDMSKPFPSKEAAIEAAKVDITWLEANRTLDMTKLKDTKVTVLTAYDPMNPPKNIAELKEYWKEVFSHFGMEMNW